MTDLYNNLFSKNTLGIAYVSEDLYIIKANQYLERLLSYERNGLKDVSLRSIISEDEYGLSERIYRSVKYGAFAPPFVRKYISKNGKIVYALVTIKAIYNKNDDFEYFMFSAYDYVRDYKTPRNIRESVLAMSLSDIPVSIFFKGVDNCYEMVNTTYLNSNSISKREIIGKKDADIFSEKLVLKFKKQEDEAKKNLKAIEFESISFIDKKQQKCKTILQSLYDGEDNFLGIVGIIYDEDLSFEEQSRQTLIHNTFECSVDGIIITDEFERILAINPAVSKITGYEEKELIGKKPSVLASGEHKKDFYDSMWASVYKNGSWQGEIINRKKNGEKLREVLTISAVKDKKGRIIHYIGSFFDLAHAKRVQAKNAYSALHDVLTGLPNRFYFELNIKQILEQATEKQEVVAIIYFDIDNFKDINDAHGHSIGDKVIILLSKRLKKVLDEKYMILRMGGDEFMVVVNDLKSEDKEHIKNIVKQIFSVFTTPFIVEDTLFGVTCSMGVATYPRDGYDMDTLAKHADAAMYQAKKDGKNTYCFYKNTITKDLIAKIETETSMRRALQNDEFFVLYQPQMSMQDDKIIGVEALVRWKHPNIGIILPNKFIPIAEENRLINGIGEKVLDIVCEDIKKWEQSKYNMDGFTVSVNVSTIQLIDNLIYHKIKEVTQKHGVLAEKLKVELTETSIMENYSNAVELFLKLNEIGVNLSIDDFGTGYSSFAYLKKFAIEQVKIDRSFMTDIPNNSDNVAIIRAIMALGKSMGLDIVAEGIEDEIQRKFLLNEGCKIAQGYFYSKPIFADELEEKYLKNL